MAQILRHGKTPLWGAFTHDDVNRKGIILDSYNYSVEVKDYEQLDEAGRVVGYLVYDQTVNYDMSGTLLYVGSTDSVGGSPANDSNEPKYTGSMDSASLSQVKETLPCVGNIMQGVAIHTWIGGVNSGITNPSKAIVKSYSVNTSQGGAATFSLSGTIYDFGQTSQN